MTPEEYKNENDRILNYRKLDNKLLIVKSNLEFLMEYPQQLDGLYSSKMANPSSFENLENRHKLMLADALLKVFENIKKDIQDEINQI